MNDVMSEDAQLQNPVVFTPIDEAEEALINADEIWEVDYAMLRKRLLGLPKQAERVLRLLDGRRTLEDVIATAPFSEELSLRVLVRLRREGVVVAPTRVNAQQLSEAQSIWHSATNAPTVKPSQIEVEQPYVDCHSTIPNMIQDTPANDTLIEDTLSQLEAEESMEPLLSADEPGTNACEAETASTVNEYTTLPGRPNRQKMYQNHAAKEHEQHADKGFTHLPELQVDARRAASLVREQDASCGLDSLQPMDVSSSGSFLASLDGGGGSFCLGDENDELSDCTRNFVTSPTVLARRANEPSKVLADAESLPASCDSSGESEDDQKSLGEQPMEPVQAFELGQMDHAIEDEGPKLLSLGPTARRILKREGRGSVGYSRKMGGPTSGNQRPLCYNRDARDEQFHDAASVDELDFEDDEHDSGRFLHTVAYVAFASAGGYGLVQAIAYFI